MSRFLRILIVCCTLTACATAPPATDHASDLDVRQASDRFWATRQRGDAAAFAEHFTDEGVLMIPGLDDASGRNAVRELAQKRFAGVRTADFKVHRREIDVCGDTAYELAWFAETYPAQNDPTRLRGRYLIVWKRGSDNVWRVHRNVYNFAGTEPLP